MSPNIARVGKVKRGGDCATNSPKAVLLQASEHDRSVDVVENVVTGSTIYYHKTTPIGHAARGIARNGRRLLQTTSGGRMGHSSSS